MSDYPKIYNVVREDGEVDVMLMPHKASGKLSFVNLTSGHICLCEFDTVEEALEDMRNNPKVISFEEADNVAPVDTNSTFDFSDALLALKAGYKVSRESWSCEKFVVRQKAYPDGIPCNAQTAEAWGMSEGDLFRCEPYLQIADNGTHYMWQPSIEDLFATDWYMFG